MATGGIFQLITNDGKQDRMLMASRLLKKRLYLIRRKRNADPRIPYKDKTPTLLDIERTHILFTNAHFKPFAAIGYEYNIVRPNSGNVKLGSEVQYSIPQFGDFFNDMCFHCIVKAPSVTFVNTPQDDEAPSVRWADYPGERLMKKVRFDVNGNPLDEYTSDDIVMHRQFRVPDHKLTGWKRNVGQQTEISGYVEDPLQGVVPGHQVYMNCCNGLQTPKDSIGWNSASAATDRPNDLEVFVPLLFWCNLDPRLAVASVAIPYGQRFIRIDLETQGRLFNWQKRGNAGFVDSDIIIADTTVTKAELYINNLFVNPEVHAIYIKRIGFTLIRVHRKQTNLINKTEDEILLQNMKWPIESLFVGLRPRVNVDGGGANPATGALVAPDAVFNPGLSSGLATEASSDLWTWHLFGEITCTAEPIPGVLGYQTTVDTTTSNSVQPVNNNGVGSEPNLICCACKPTFDEIRISAHGIPIYTDFPQQFYQSYISYTYGGYNINTPTDCGLVMINFCLYPGTYQPSGHVNVSRAREFYIKFTTKVTFSDSNTADLIVVASALNFLLISDGSAVLRYST